MARFRICLPGAWSGWLRPAVALLVVPVTLMAHERADAGPVPFITIDSTGTEDDADLGDGTCVTAEQRCTVYAAFQEFLQRDERYQFRFNLLQTDPGYDPVSDTWTIVLDRALPTLTRGDLTIDGSSQPGFVDRPVLTFDAGLLAPGSFVIQTFDADDIFINGLAFVGATDDPNTAFGEGAGLLFNGGFGHQATANWFGIRANGEAEPNTIGAWDFETTNTLLARNVVSGNTTGVLLQRTEGATLENNIIGLNADGTVILGNTGEGVRIIDSPDTTVNNNTISGNGAGPGTGGIVITNFTAPTEQGFLSIINNHVGTDITGNVAIGNQNGVFFAPSTNNLQSYDSINIANNVVGGSGS